MLWLPAILYTKLNVNGATDKLFIFIYDASKQNKNKQNNEIKLSKAQMHYCNKSLKILNG